MGFPYLFEERLLIGNCPDCPVAVCTLWSLIDRYKESIPRDLYSVIGPLYSHSGHGVSIIARNILSHPHIRTIVICGEDKSGSRASLLNWKIPADDTVLKDEDLNWLRNNIRFIDTNDLLPTLLYLHNEQQQQQQQNLPMISFLPKIIDMPMHNPNTVDHFPSEEAGFHVSATSIDMLWRKALKTIIRYGIEKKSHYGKFREVLTLCSLLDGDDPTLPCTLEEAENYLTAGGWKEKNPIVPPDISYTYPNRIRAHFGYDQWERAIEYLKKDSGSRYSYISLWDHAIDGSQNSSTRPCMVDMQMHLNDTNKLHLRVTFRSHDIGQAYPLNLMALRWMQSNTAREHGWICGTLTVISSSAHVYEYYLQEARREAEKARPCEWDRRGNISITKFNGELIARLQSRDSDWLHEYRGKTPALVMEQLMCDDCLKSPGNWVWVSLELAKVFYC